MEILNYDAVIFDLDGTLVDSMWVWSEIDNRFLGSLNIETPKDMESDLEGKSFTETAAYFKERFQLTMSVEEIMACWNKLAWEFYTHQVPLKRGAREWLEYLKVHNIKMGIATSNSIQLVKQVLKVLNIEEYFSAIKTGCEVGKGKPHPDIYLKTAEALQVNPSRCLVFEDIPNGIRAGQRAGMEAWAINDRQNEKVKQELITLASRFIEDYNEAIAYFAKK